MSSTTVALTPSKPSQALHLNKKPLTNASLTTTSLQQKPLPRSPSTPQAQKPQSTPLPSQPGTWRHPNIDDIVRRQNRSVFNGENVRWATHYGVLFVVSLIAPPLTTSLQPKFLTALLNPYRAEVVLAIQAFFLLCFLASFRPLLQKHDDMQDIPLTPSQRSLLGLKPSATPLTPGSQYVTPPRYSRSATPRSNLSDRVRGASPGASPLDGRGRSGSVDRGAFGQSRGAGSGSPYSGSPLVQKALTGSASRRSSIDVGGSGLSGSAAAIGTGRASVGLNNKWLYERGRGNGNLFS